MGTEPAVALGVKIAFAAAWSNPSFRLGFDFGALAMVIAAASLLAGQAWGWWALAINAGLTLLIPAVTMMMPNVQVTTTPWIAGVRFAVSELVVGAMLYALLGDPPRKWRVPALKAES